jgi:chaperonin GroES
VSQNGKFFPCFVLRQNTVFKQFTPRAPLAHRLQYLSAKRPEVLRPTQTNTDFYLMAFKLKPLGARVLVEPVTEQEVKRGGIIIPDSAKEKPTEAIVCAVGPGDVDHSGKRVPLEVKEGDRVLISKYGGTEVKINDKEYKVLSKDDILAVVE